MKIYWFWLTPVILCLVKGQENEALFPGYQPSRTIPLIAKVLDLPLNANTHLKGGLLYGPTDYIPPPPNEAFLPVPTGNGNVYMVPKIFYSKFNSNANFNSKLKTPDFTDPLNLINDFISTGGRAEKQDNTLGGIYVPLPYGLAPVAFQLIQEDKRDNSGSAGLGLNHFKQPESVVPPVTNLMMKALNGAVQYLDQTRNVVPLSSDKNEQVSFNAPPETEKYQPNDRPLIFAEYVNDPDQVQNYAAVQRSESPVKPSIMDQAVQGLARPDFIQRLTSNLMTAINSNQNRSLVSDKQINNNPPVNFGGFQDANNLTKSTGLYISIPFLPPSYLGGYINHDKNDVINFG